MTVTQKRGCLFKKSLNIYILNIKNVIQEWVVRINGLESRYFFYVTVISRLL